MIATYGIDKARSVVPAHVVLMLLCCRRRFCRALVPPNHHRLCSLLSARPDFLPALTPRASVFEIEQNILQSNATQYFGVAKTALHGRGKEAHARAKAAAMADIARFYAVPPRRVGWILFDCSIVRVAEYG